MSLPPKPVLRGALRWLEHLSSSDVTRTRALFTSHSAFSDITPTQYAAAFSWLEETGLLGKAVPPETRTATLFEAAIADTYWLPDADLLVPTASELPEDALRAAAILDLSAEHCLAAIRRVWGKVDTAERLRVGSAGELALIELLSSASDADIRHVAAESDGYGYDIEVIARGSTVHLEVKSTTRRGRLTIHMTRNEYETMCRDDVWSLVAVRLDQDLVPAAVATVDRAWLVAAAPVDRSLGTRWESARLSVPSQALMRGIPSIISILDELPPPILAGEPLWPG